MPIMRSMRSAIVPLAVWLIAAPASADQISLSNGQSLEGIIVRQTDAELIVRIAWEGYIVLDRASVASIEPASEMERQRLLDAWHTEHDAFEEHEERKRAFEEAQRAKGLVLYRGEWVTKEEIVAIKAETQSAQEERRKREAAEAELKRQQEVGLKMEGELGALTQRLQVMQEEQLRLQQEIAALRSILARRYQRHIGYPLPSVVRDPNGRNFPVRIAGSRTYIELPGGLQCDLDVTNGGYRYLDPSGVWHDVQPLDAP